MSNTPARIVQCDILKVPLLKLPPSRLCGSNKSREDRRQFAIGFDKRRAAIENARSMCASALLASICARECCKFGAAPH
jgi:hypothetical protein